MGLFDIIKEKASELFSGASEKVSEVTGVDVPGADQVAQSADNLADTATTAGETITDTAQDVTGSAAESITDATDPKNG
jgi:hypothetical protein